MLSHPLSYAAVRTDLELQISGEAVSRHAPGEIVAVNSVAGGADCIHARIRYCPASDLDGLAVWAIEKRTYHPTDALRTACASVFGSGDGTGLAIRKAAAILASNLILNIDQRRYPAQAIDRLVAQSETIKTLLLGKALLLDDTIVVHLFSEEFVLTVGRSDDPLRAGTWPRSVGPSSALHIKTVDAPTDSPSTLLNHIQSSLSWTPDGWKQKSWSGIVVGNMTWGERQQLHRRLSAYDLDPLLLEISQVRGKRIVVLEEFDQVAGRLRKQDAGGDREKVLEYILSFFSPTTTETCGVFLAMTDRPMDLDTVVTRSGRFDVQIDFGSAREKNTIYRHHHLKHAGEAKGFQGLYGIDSILETLRKSVVLPFARPEIGLPKPRGVLICGPSGVGKTTLAMALATELGFSTIYVEGPQVRSKNVGQSEKSIADLFSKAHSDQPCAIIIDQADVLLQARGSSSSSEGTDDRIITCFLTELDGVRVRRSAVPTTAQNVLVIAEKMDSAILRRGRLDERINIPLPSPESRAAILQGILARTPNALSQTDIERLAKTTEGLTGAGLVQLCNKATMDCIREGLEGDLEKQSPVEWRHFAVATFQ
ncbi:P-loop containing nucleoside triphosphate hydrolase protein [Polychytrium aggregatum]|uniref:P-loop containing nucleoside triphosphate hydrolase protein n=1 Tax=Polychytrium aggregatum TaxID=110093 RepID=UPI0022FF40EB|nr:P-loop containing nucleoside triphosphate hydrolase protein [Polychytrium aggregatum]KAI9209601.1 P-loop containing nucleoside triphosphate hydrolase protein [Polychytrium aggregatum]